MSALNVTVLGDDLYCRQPLCQQLLDQQFNFILVCRPESHTTLYEHLDGIDLPTLTTKRWTGRFEETYTYRYLNGVPRRDSDDALLVNWCEVTVSRPDGKMTYKNSFATNHTLSDENVAEIVLTGRTRWKVENKTYNTLKTKGYNSEHNFGHGKQHLSSLLATLNILSLLFHTLLELLDQKYKLLRSHLPTHKTFFDDLRTLTRYMYFDSWDHLLTFMLEGLELQIPSNTSRISIMRIAGTLGMRWLISSRLLPLSNVWLADLVFVGIVALTYFSTLAGSPLYAFYHREAKVYAVAGLAGVLLGLL